MKKIIFIIIFLCIICFLGCETKEEDELITLQNEIKVMSKDEFKKLVQDYNQLEYSNYNFVEYKNDISLVVNFSKDLQNISNCLAIKKIAINDSNILEIKNEMNIIDVIKLIGIPKAKSAYNQNSLIYYTNEKRLSFCIDSNDKVSNIEISELKYNSNDNQISLQNEIKNMSIDEFYSFIEGYDKFKYSNYYFAKYKEDINLMVNYSKESLSIIDCYAYKNELINDNYKRIDCKMNIIDLVKLIGIPETNSAYNQNSLVYYINDKRVVVSLDDDEKVNSIEVKDVVETLSVKNEEIENIIKNISYNDLIDLNEKYKGFMFANHVFIKYDDNVNIVIKYSINNNEFKIVDYYIFNQKEYDNSNISMIDLGMDLIDVVKLLGLPIGSFTSGVATVSFKVNDTIVITYVDVNGLIYKAILK